MTRIKKKKMVLYEINCLSPTRLSYDHCFARNQDNVSEWGDMSIRGLLFQ